MKICVCIKQVPDVSAPIQIRGGELAFDAGRMVLNAYDASAVEAALVIVGNTGGEVELVTVGDEHSREAVRKALAMGADRAVHLQVDPGQEADSMTYARILAAYLKGAGFDFVFCGKQAQDTDAGLAGGMIAALLGLPYVTNAVGIEVEDEGRTLAVTRQGDTGQEIVELPAPGLVTCSNDMNDPRIPNVKGIMAAKRKPIDSQAAVLPPEGAPSTRVTGYEPLPEREAGRILQGEPDEIVQQLVSLLRTEARVL
jgi:electron transfer flavoprotein beta subunit